MSEQHQIDHQPKPIFWLVFLSLLFLAAMMLTPFVPALLWATVLSVLFFPLLKKLLDRGWDRGKASLAITIGTALLVIVPLAGTGVIAGIQASQVITEMNANAKPGDTALDKLGHELDLQIGPTLASFGIKDFSVHKYIQENGQNLVRNSAAPLASFVGKLVMNAVSMVIAVLTMFYMLRDGPKLIKPVCDLMPLPRDETLRLLKRQGETIREVFYGVFIVALIQGAIAAITYGLLGITGWFLWATLTFVLCCIPLLGAPMVYVPLALKLLIDGKTTNALILLGVGFGILSLIDNFLRPYYIKSEELPPIALFFCLLGGVLFFGPIGIVAGPMLITLIIGFINVLRTRRQIADGTYEPEANLVAEPE